MRATLTAVRSTGRSLLPKGGFARGVAVLTGSTALSQALIVAASPLLTRLYTPADFGVLAGYSSILMLLISVASLRYDLAIPVAEDDGDAANLLVVALGLAGLLSVIVGACVWVSGELVPSVAFMAPLSPYLWLFPFAVFGAGSYQALAAWAVRHGEYGRIALTRAGQSAAQVGLQVGVGVFGGGAVWLVVGDVVGRGTGSATLGTVVWRREWERLRAVTWDRLRAVAVRYRRFPLYASGSALLNTSGLQLPSLLFAVLYGPAVAGFFLLAQRVMGMPMTLLGTSVGQVYLGEAARVAREDPRRLAPLFTRLTRTMLLYCGGPILVIGAFAPFFFGSVFGAGWEVAGQYVRLMAPMSLAQVVVSPISNITAVLERQRVQLLLDAFRTAVVAVAIFVPWVLECSPLTAIGAYSGGMVVTYVAFYVVYHNFVLPPAASKGER